MATSFFGIIHKGERNMTEQIITEKNVPCTLRDGTILRADVYRPGAPGTYPVLLTRLPYGKDDPFFSHRYIDTNRLVLAGYVVIVQDVRGRYQSGGEFYPFEFEAEDGYDTVEWAANLPYANGKVGMFGLSYYGFTQLLAAKEKPPHLHALFPTMTLNDLETNMVKENGLPKLASMKTWILESMVPDLLRRTYTDQAVLAEKMEQWADGMDQLAASYDANVDDTWPILQTLGVAEEFYKIFDKAKTDPLWKQTSLLEEYDQINYPAIHLGGWYDSLLNSTIENYVQMHQQTNKLQRLIIGPWTHGDFGSMQGERDFGIRASEHLLDGKEDLTNLHLRWFDHWLKGKETGVLQDAPVQLFVMGSNEWRNEQTWPLERAKNTPYYFHSDGNANTRFGDGWLHAEKPTTLANDQYVHRPDQPVPSKGGKTMYHSSNSPGPLDQCTIEEREDVLVYSTPVLDEAIEVTGPLHVSLWAKSTAKETTFTAKLVDVAPDGTAYQLADGIAPANFTDEDATVQVEINLWATSNTFLKGHRIRVEIASASHPQYDCSPAYDHTGTKLEAVTQTILHDSEHPSHIILPIIPKEG